jgi:hypothetical protein
VPRDLQPESVGTGSQRLLRVLWVAGRHYDDGDILPAWLTGRPTEGIVDPGQIQVLLTQALDDHIAWAESDEPPPFRTARGRKKNVSGLAAHLVYKLVKEDGVNVAALARVHPASRATLKRWVTQETELRERGAEVLTTQLDRLEANLTEQLDLRFERFGRLKIA